MIRHTEIRDTFNDFSDDTLSLYLHVDAGYIENQAEKPAWQIYLKNALSSVKTAMETDKQAVWSAIEEQVDNFFTDYSQNGTSLVMLIDKDHLFTLSLPFKIDNQYYFGKPYVSPLLWAIDEYEQYMVVLVDRERARLYDAYLGNLETAQEMTINLESYDWGEKTLMPASDSDGSALRQGNNREAFEDMIDAHIDRFYNEVAEEIRTQFSNNETTRLILGGDERTAHLLLDKLHQSVADHVVAILPIPVDSSTSEIAERIKQPAYNYERDYEFELVDDIMSKAYANGRGALGREAIDTKMEMQQVELLVMASSLLTENKDYAHKMTMWALNHNVSIEFVHGQAARKLEDNDGVAARLYYSLETA